MERVLINQLDEHNEGGILAARFFNVTRCIYFYTKEQNELLEQIKQYFKNNLPKIKVDDVLINEGDNHNILSTVNKYKNTNLVVNLAGGKRINSLLLSIICINNSFKSIYVDIKNKKLYKLSPEYDVKDIDYDDLELLDIVSSAGGEIVAESSDLIKKEDIVYLTEKIYRNLNLWHKYKNKLYDNNIFTHDYLDKEKVSIHLDKLNNEEKSIVNKCLTELKRLRGIDYINNNGVIEVEFLNKYIKSFIFKSGTWLEVATHNLINRIKGIDDIKSGVMFLWNTEQYKVRNEIDVVAIKDSVTICISCKDSDKYDEVALNELNIYSNKIGGKDTIKILVATKEPCKGVVRERAKAMGINLVIFTGDEKAFITHIESLIN